MSNRTPRESETRETTSRKKTWVRPSALPLPKPMPGIKYRWVRAATLGESDNRNVSVRFREGYTPVKASDHPEMMLLPDLDSRFAEQGNIEVGGLMLCSIPAEVAESRQEQQNEAASQQMEAETGTISVNHTRRCPFSNRSGQRGLNRLAIDLPREQSSGIGDYQDVGNCCSLWAASDW